MHAFQKYGGLLCNYAYSYLNNREEAEDVVQEVFLQLLETEKVFPFNDIAIKSYLLKSVRNSCLNILKKKKHFWSIRKTEQSYPLHTRFLSSSYPPRICFAIFILL